MTQRQATIALFLGSASTKSCPFGHGTDNAGEKFGNLLSQIGKEKVSMRGLFPCATTPTAGGEFAAEDYETVVDNVLDLYDAQPAEVSAGSNPRASFAGCMMRLAGHDFMDYRTHADGPPTGGSDGCLNFDDPDNTGLPSCIEKYKLASAYQKTCDKVSLADFVVIAGEAVMGRTATDFDPHGDYYGEGTFAKTLRDGFRGGRITNENCNEDAGLMPNPAHGCQGLDDIFNKHIYKDTGMAWTMTAAISGAHTIGSAKVANSGYEGFWSSEEQQGLFNNDYYTSILVTGWGPELREVEMNGEKVRKDQWMRVDRQADYKSP